jgi:hypothetical protein
VSYRGPEREVGVDPKRFLEDPALLAAVGGALVLIVVIVIVARSRKRVRGVVVDDSKARARAKVRKDLQTFRDDLKRSLQTAGPVFRKIETETEHTNVVGHWRTSMKHRIDVRVPNLGELKITVRGLGYDAQSLIDLDAAWKKTGRTVAEYNAGKQDGSRTPIAFAKEFEKDLNKIVLLANMCLSKYGS